MSSSIPEITQHKGPKLWEPRSGVPFVIGITGRMKIVDGDQRELIAAFEKVVNWIRGRKTISENQKQDFDRTEKLLGPSLGLADTPIIILSSLAPGIDTLIAKWALTYPCSLVTVKAPVPFHHSLSGEDFYEQASTFQRALRKKKEDESEDDYQAFVAAEKPLLECANELRVEDYKGLKKDLGPKNMFFVERGTDADEMRRRSPKEAEEWLMKQLQKDLDSSDPNPRNYRYRAAGEYVSTYCDLLVAFTDGPKFSHKTPVPRKGLDLDANSGTDFIVRSHLEGRRAGVLPVQALLSSADNGAVVRIFTRDNEGQPRERTGEISFFCPDDTPGFDKEYFVSEEIERGRLREHAKHLRTFQAHLKDALKKDEGDEWDSDEWNTFQAWQVKGHFSHRDRRAEAKEKWRRYPADGLADGENAPFLPWRSAFRDTDLNTIWQRIRKIIRSPKPFRARRCPPELKAPDDVALSPTFSKILAQGVIAPMAAMRRIVADLNRHYDDEIKSVRELLFALALVVVVFSQLAYCATRHTLITHQVSRETGQLATNTGDWLLSILFGSAAFFTIGLGWFCYHRWIRTGGEGRLHDIVNDSRALAEALRVQLYWSAAGTGCSVASHYLQRSRGRISWVRAAISSLAMPYEESRRQFAALSSAEQLEVLQTVRNSWVLEQEQYFGKTAHDFGNRQLKGKLRALTLLWAGSFLFALNWIPWPTAVNVPWTVLLGLLFLGCLLAWDLGLRHLLHLGWSPCEHGGSVILRGFFRKLRKAAATGWLLAALQGLALACALRLLWPALPTAEDGAIWGVVLRNSLLAVGGLWLTHQSFGFLSQNAERYSSMREVFAGARHRLDAQLARLKEAVDHGAEDDCRAVVQDIHQLLEALGCEAIHENTDWLQMHRNKPISPFFPNA